MNVNKIIGFVLLGVGLAIIFYSLFSSYLIFTGSNEAPAIFAEQEQGDTKAPSFSAGSLEDLQNQIPDLLGEQLEGFLPAGTFPQMLNLAVWSMFASLLLFGGSLVAGIGVKLLRG